MRRDDIYLLPYLSPDSWRSAGGLHRRRSGSSHKQSRCCERDAQMGHCQGDSGGSEGVWGPGEAAERDDRAEQRAQPRGKELPAQGRGSGAALGQREVVWVRCPLCSQCFCAFCGSGFILIKEPAQRGGDVLRQAGARHRFTAAPAPCSEREKPVPFGTRTGLPQAGSRCGSRCWKESCSPKHESCQSSLAFSPIYFPGVKFFRVPAGASQIGRQW